MNEIRETLNISYFDKEELDLTDEYVENSNKEYKESLTSPLNEILK